MKKKTHHARTHARTGSSAHLSYIVEQRGRNMTYSRIRRQIKLIYLGSISVREGASGHKYGVGEKARVDSFCAHC